MPTKTEITEFSTTISNKVANDKLSHMDAVVAYCEETGMEIDVASTLLSPTIKAKIREEAQELNLIKKTSKLPI